jgi:hypothetical protein
LDKEGSTHERTLFPAPAAEVNIKNPMESMRAKNTHVSRVSIKENWNGNASTLSTLHYESTMSRFRCAEIHERYCDSSMGLGETATFEYLAVISYLKGVMKLSALPVINGTIEE